MREGSCAFLTPLQSDGNGKHWQKQKNGPETFDVESAFPPATIYPPCGHGLRPPPPIPPRPPMGSHWGAPQTNSPRGTPSPAATQAEELGTRN